MTFTLGTLIYLNFFTHHYILDARYLLFATTLILFIRTRVWFRIANANYWMPLPLAALLTNFFHWVARITMFEIFRSPCKIIFAGRR